ncbi:MAG: phage head-tail connector protein [Pseudomonadota bacterium]
MTERTVITPPAEAPLTLDAVKAFLRIGHDGEDDLLADLLQSARDRLEQAAGLALVVQTVRVVWTDWPAEIRGRGARLPIAPVRQLDAVRVADADTAATDCSGQFQLVCGRVHLRPWHTLPSLPMGGTIEIDVQVGFGVAIDVPDDLREALLRLIGALYSARVADHFAPSKTEGLPRDVQAILDARKEVRL